MSTQTQAPEQSILNEDLVKESGKPSQERLSAAYDESDIIRRTHVGGQALIEGVMMRGRYNWALAVRKPDGTIHVEEHDLVSGKDKNSWMYKPVVRGCTALVESLALGFKALEIAANHAYDFDEEEDDAREKLEGPQELETSEKTPSVILDLTQDTSNGITSDKSGLPIKSAMTIERDISDNEPLGKAAAIGAAAETTSVIPSLTRDPADESAMTAESAETAVEEFAAKEAQQESKDDGALPKGLMTFSMVLGVLLGVALFIVVPAVVTNLLVGDYGEKTLLWNIVDGILRVAIFILYIFLIGRMSDIKRMFGYHGAEHRTIHCYERGKDLTVLNAQAFPSLHVRCGTAFMLMTMIIAILVFTIVPVNLLIDGLGIQNEILRLLVVILSRIVLLPLIAGLSYEFTVKWAGSHPDNPIVKVVLWPGLQLQRLTTNPPDDGMVECAIAAMNAVLAREELEAQKAA